ncbi:glycosyl hydrolase family protein [Candidatus Saccharibacteria bacterium]|nr:MAG: glycosyl hydrolase family protein [Candidatus Saccharibacteria bacterium]
MHKHHYKSIILVCTVLAFAAVGSILYTRSRAATPTAAVEAEAGTVDSPAITATDSIASGGSAVKFTTASGIPQPVGPTSPTSGWKLDFDDEFNGTSLDKTRWSDMDGRSMNKVTTYASNISVSGGNLVLTLASSTSGAFISSSKADGAGANGYLFPVGSYAEARVYFPGNGTAIYNWPAWWTSGPNWPAAGEHDVAEGLGTLTVNYHSPSGSHNMGTISGTWSNAFHTYGVYRKASSADVYWDGVKVKSYTTDDNGGAQSLLVNVGYGNTKVYGVDSQVKVDWIRSWSPQ